jgi:hypothetical protein
MSGALFGAVGGAPGVVASSLPNGGDPSGAGAVWGLASDGNVQISNGDHTVDTTTDWVSPADSKIAAFYQVKVDPTSGSFTSGSATGTYFDCSSNPSWSKSGGGVVTFTATIREKVTGLVRQTYVGLTLSG